MMSDNELELISVVMPCYNSEKYIKEAIDSVLDQTYQKIELIVIDDGSTDLSKEIVQAYGDKIVLIEEKHQGPPPPRNKGIQNSHGKFIAFLDADDYWRKDFLEKMYQGIKGTDAVLSYCGWQNVDNDGPIGKPYIPPDYEKGDKRDYFLRAASPWPIHSVLIRKDALIELKGFTNKWAYCEDYELWLKLAITRQIVIVPEVMSYYRHYKKLKDTGKRGIDADFVRKIKIDFVNTSQELLKDIPEEKLKEYIGGHFLWRGYQYYWRRDLVSAHIIFRISLKSRYGKLKDIRYILPALLPKWAYVKLISFVDGLKKV